MVDCLQLDVTRCGGYTGWLRGAAVAAGAQPAGLRALRARPARVRSPPPCPNLRHVEWFVDHARLEPLLVDGRPTARHGALHPDHTARGHGMTIAAKPSDGARDDPATGPVMGLAKKTTEVDW